MPKPNEHLGVWIDSDGNYRRVKDDSPMSQTSVHDYHVRCSNVEHAFASGAKPDLEGEHYEIGRGG